MSDRPIYVPKWMLEDADRLDILNRIIRGQTVKPDEWKRLTRAQLYSLWVREDQTVDIESLRLQGKTEDDIEWISHPFRSPLIDATASPEPIYRTQAIRNWQSLAYDVQHQPWIDRVPDELKRPWSDSLPVERQLELWSHADPDVDVPTLMRQANVSYQDAVLGKYPYRRTLMTLGRPDPAAQVRYRDHLNNLFEAARFEAVRTAAQREARMTPYAQLQQAIIEKLFEARTTPGSKGLDFLVSTLGRPPQDVADAVKSLRRRGFLTLIGTDQNDFVHIELTDLGVDLAREGPDAFQTSQTGPVYNTHFHAGVQNAAVGNTGGVTQISVQQSADLATVLQQIRGIIGEMEIDDDERADLVKQTEYLEEEANRDSPRPARLKRLLDGIGHAADIYSLTEAGQKLLPLVVTLGHLLAHLMVGTPPSLPPGLMA